jgi:uncharacterized protein YegJ (DUF2314 family)
MSSSPQPSSSAAAGSGSIHSTQTVAYPRYYTLIGWFCFAVFGLIAALTQLIAEPVGIGILALFSALSLLGLFLVYASWRGTLRYSEQGVRYRPFFSPAFDFTWADIRSAEYRPGLQVVVLTLADGRTAWLSPMQVGYTDFVAEAERRSGVEIPVVVDLGQTPGVFTDDKDELMLAAIAQARATLPRFLECLRLRSDPPEAFSLKVRLFEPDGRRAEQVWLVDLEETTSGAITGVINNDLVQVRSYRPGQRVPVDPDNILDWGLHRDGQMHGNYTLRAMLPRLPSDEARRLRPLLADSPDPEPTR